MNVRNTAKSFVMECNRVHRCKDCSYKDYCRDLFKDNNPCNLGLQQVEYILYNRIFGCIDISNAMNELKGENY